MQRSTRRLRASHLASTLFAVLLAGCGGGAASAPPKTAAAEGAGGKSGDSIGGDALAQGGLSGLSSTAAPGATGLAAALHADKIETPVKMDGVPREWPARTSASEAIEPAASGVTAAFGVQYDDDKLWIAGEISDAHFLAGKSHASLVLAIPGAGGSLVPYEVGFFPGKPGDTAGSVRMLSGGGTGKDVPGAKIVEAPSTSGITFEAMVPLATFPETRSVRVGLRASARYYAHEKGILATGRGDVKDPTSLPSLPTESEQSILDALLTPRGLADKPPSFDVYADVTGDAQKERLSVYGRYFVVCGGAYRKGTEFFYKDLGGEALSLETRNLTGRAKEDILLRRRVTLASGSVREWLEVWTMDGDEPVPAFAHEIAVEHGGKRVANDVHVTPKEIEVHTGTVTGWDAASYKEAPSADVDGILLPWGRVAEEQYRFDATQPHGGKFVKKGEVAQKGNEAAVAATPPAERVKPAEPPTPPARAASGDLGRALLDQYRREHNVPESVRPKNDVSVDVAEDARPERVVLIGRDLVVFGPGFHGGSTYAFITLSQFADEADVKELSVRDLTGDGKADLVVRGVRHVSAQDPKAAPSAQPMAIDFDALFVYEVKADKVARVFAIETGRASGERHAQGLVQFVPAPGGKGFEVDVRPGRVTGWTEKTYPWAQDQPGSGALEPLLLPWGGIPSLRYAYDGTQFNVKR